MIETLKTDWYRTAQGKVRMGSLQKVTEDGNVNYMINGDINYPFSEYELANEYFKIIIEQQEI